MAFATPTSLRSTLSGTHYSSTVCIRRRRSVTASPKRLRTLMVDAINENVSDTSPSIPVSQSLTNKYTLSYTCMENNSFMLSYQDINLLIDPWLYDDLVFLTPKFYRQIKPKPSAPDRDVRNLDVSNISAIILTQGLADHAHPPTLEKLSKDIPVIAPPSAKPILTSLGYRKVTYANYEDVIKPFTNVDITITAFKGAKVGPPWSEEQLGFLFSFGDKDPTTFYHEPHGMHDINFLKDYRGKVDILSVPIVESAIPKLGNYALVNGNKYAVDTCKKLLPSACLPFDNSGGEGSGFLSNYIVQKGGYDTFVESVKKEESLKNMELIPPPGPMNPIVIAGQVMQED